MPEQDGPCFMPEAVVFWTFEDEHFRAERHERFRNQAILHPVAFFAGGDKVVDITRATATNGNVMVFGVRFAPAIEARNPEKDSLSTFLAHGDITSWRCSGPCRI